MKIASLACACFVVALLTIQSNATVTSGSGAAIYPLLDEILHSKHRSALTVAEIPQVVRATLLGLMKYDPRLSNPGERINDTDALLGDYPRRSLIVAAGTPKAWFVAYNHGGRGFPRDLVVFSVKNGIAVCTLTCDLTRTDVVTVSDIRRAIDHGRIPCEPCDTNGYF